METTEARKTVETAGMQETAEMPGTAEMPETPETLETAEVLETAGAAELPGPERRPLNREAIKYIAVIAMTFNHIAHASLLPYGSPLYELFVDIGYVTAVTMSFFLVEGYHYTRSKARYCLRLFLFALLAQAPYSAAFQTDTLNMFFTLWLCFLILLVLDRVPYWILRIPILAVLVFLSLFCDWPLTIAVSTILFAWSRRDKRRQVLSYALAALLHGYMEYAYFSTVYAAGDGALHALGAAVPMGVSAVLTLGLYNGTQARNHRAFHRWFFYIYYPAHLTLLCLIRYRLYGW